MMRATDTDIISSLIRAALLFPYVSADILSPRGYVLGAPTAQLVDETGKGPKEVGITTEEKNKDFLLFFFLPQLLLLLWIGE